MSPTHPLNPTSTNLQLHPITKQTCQADRAARRRPAGPYALILAPTRELAQQIKVEADRLGRPLRVGNACLYGGSSKGPQGMTLRRGPQVRGVAPFHGACDDCRFVHPPSPHTTPTDLRTQPTPNQPAH
jgi:hypothetical protein